MQVELKYAGLPYLGLIAVHYWFVTVESGKRDRWEVWQGANAGGFSVGHLHRNLMGPDLNVGGGPTRLAHCWTGAPAECIAGILYESWEKYPYHDWYRVLPGLNSNTYVAWILQRAEIEHRLSWRGIGKNFVVT